MQRRLTALGHLKIGQMNKTETAYAKTLEQQKRSGEILDYWFEAIKLKIADNACTYTPDFLVLTNKGELELHEVKGAKAVFADDAKVKCKVCADKYPFRLKVVFPIPKKQGGGWEIQEF